MKTKHRYLSSGLRYNNIHIIQCIVKAKVAPVFVLRCVVEKKVKGNKWKVKSTIAMRLSILPTQLGTHSEY